VGSAPERIRFTAPLKGATMASDSMLGAGPTAAEIEARVRDAYEKGFNEASKQISQQILEQRGEVNHLRDRLFRSLEEGVTGAIGEVRAALPVLTMQALRRVLSRAEITRETVGAIVDELLTEIGPDVGPIEVRLHPADLRLVEDLEPQLARVHPGLRFVADEALGRGDSQAVTRYGKVDARLQNKLEKIEASLLPPG
jgi:flagellar biosynthesis/type III secretory pathway protein FliH